MSVKVIITSTTPQHLLEDILPGECFVHEGELYQRFNTVDILAEEYFTPNVIESKNVVRCYRIRDGSLNGYSRKNLVFKVNLSISVEVK